MEYKIYEDIKEFKKNYETGSINILSGLTFSQNQKLRMCEFYSNSRYLNSLQDEPFYNIVNFRVTLAKVATDTDTKDIQITSDDPKHFVESMLLNKECYEWMKRTNFGLILNQMGYKRPKYGGVIVKKTEVDGELKIECLDWRNIFTDQVDILSNPIGECHYMSPKDLLSMRGVWDAGEIEDCVEAFSKQSKNTKNSKQQDAPAGKIEVYEVHGEFPLSYFNELKGKKVKDGDEYEYVRLVTYFGEINNKCYYFFAEKETDLSHDYLPWEKMEGRALGRGVIEDAEEAQVWTNDSIKNEKLAMDLAGKVVLKSTTKKLANSVLEVDHGKIFELDPNTDMGVMNLAPAALGHYDALITKWRDQVDRATSSFDANTGEQPPANTPYSQTALLNQVASRPFDYRREEMGIFLTRIFEKWVIPYLVKKLYSKHLLVSDFTEDELDYIDSRFAEVEARKATKNALLQTPPQIVSPMSEELMKEKIKADLSKNGSRRYIQIPDGFFEGIQAKVTVVTTNEQRNKAAVLQSLSSLLQTIMPSYNPQTGTFAVLENPVLSGIFKTIVEISGSGISPVMLGNMAKKQPLAPSAPMNPMNPMNPTSPVTPVTPAPTPANG